VTNWATAPDASTASPISRLAPAALLVFIAAAVSLVAAQTRYPIFTLENFVTTMKTVGRNFTGVNQSVAKGDFETAKAQLARSREQLAITITYWRDRQKDDAIGMLKDSLTKMDALDAMLSSETVDEKAAASGAQQVADACQACHSVYREQDPATKTYRIKGSLAP
jgi:cytochrome c556